MKVDLGPLPFWFHDLCSCLQDCFGTLLLARGHDPVEVLGASWSFVHDPEQVRGEEFYYPARRPTLGEDLAPFHPLRAVWVHAGEPDEAWDCMRKALVDGRPLIAAVDNFNMPNRPAYGDVHAAHLVVVSGFDDAAGSVDLVESTPPTYRGAIPLESFLSAIGSYNEARPGSVNFFAGTAIGCRWIDVELDHPFPAVTDEWVAEVVAANVQGFLATAADSWVGVDGLGRYLASVDERVEEGRSREALGELYTVGWAHQAGTALHADFLQGAGAALRWPEGLEVARRVDRLANQWTPVRILAAHGATKGLDVSSRLRRRTRELVARHEAVLDDLDRSLCRLAGAGA